MTDQERLAEIANSLEPIAERIANYVRLGMSQFLAKVEPQPTPEQVTLVGAFAVFLMSGAKIETIPELFNELDNKVNETMDAMRKPKH